MELLEFSEEEIKQQLEVLGYRNIGTERIQEFKKDLDALMRSGEWTSLVSPEVSQIDGAESSPPAFTKEKVSRSCLGQSGDGFFLHHQSREQDARVLSPLNRPPAPPPSQWRRLDSYSRSSVAPKSWLHRGEPDRVQDQDQSRTEAELQDSQQSHSFVSSEGGQRGAIKRKVLRKHRGRSLVCDESVYSEDSGASCLEERLADLQLSPSLHSENENHSQSESSESESAFHSYSRGMSQSQSDDSDFKPKPKSFIRPILGPTGLKKTDPVAKYFQYKQLWDLFKLPGENDRKALRWEIRERLAYYQPPEPRPRRALVPNSYVVPTEKKRSRLRWEIRNDLAEGVPHSYRF